LIWQILNITSWYYFAVVFNGDVTILLATFPFFIQTIGANFLEREIDFTIEVASMDNEDLTITQN
jgi:hypothetical protein